jgi:phage tail tape-measure protein
MDGKQKAAMIGGAAVSLGGVIGGAMLGMPVPNVGIAAGSMLGGQVAGQLNGFINSLAPNEQITRTHPRLLPRPLKTRPLRTCWHFWMRF